MQILGRQPRHRVLELMAEADVLTLQSIMTPSGMSEGIPVCLMEAMASGVPVIASSIRGIPELVEHGRTGLLVPHSDAHALGEALMTIYTSPSPRPGTCYPRQGKNHPRVRSHGEHSREAKAV